MPHKYSQGKIKVVRIIARLNIGGPALQALILTQELRGSRFSPYLITGIVGPDESDMTVSSSGKNGHPLVIAELGREISWISDFGAFLKLFIVLRKIRPHIVHTHTAKAGTLGRLAAVLARVPIRVHTFHGHVFEGYFGRMKTRIFLSVEKCLARITDCIVVVSECQRQELVDKYRVSKRSKFQVVPLGFDLTTFFGPQVQKSLREDLDLTSSSFVIGFIGRLVTIKNPLLLLKAVHDLEKYMGVHSLSSQKSASPIKVVIAGGGELHDSLKDRIQADEINSQVIFLGWQRDMARIYSAIDVLVLTSLNEGTPVVLIEAMASCRPFIATKVGGVQDLMVGEGTRVRGENGGWFTLYENGILIGSQDVQGLIGALLYLISHSNTCCSMGRVGREFVKKRFTKERLLGDLQTLYEDLLKTKKIEIKWA